MNPKEKNYSIKFRTKLQKFQGKGGWHFVMLPYEESVQIKYQNIPIRKGWGSVNVTARIGKSEWQTSIFPDSKSGCYMLPIKAGVRKKEAISEGKLVDINLICKI